MKNGWPALVCVALGACGGQEPDLHEADVASLHDYMQRGDLRSEDLVDWYLERIETIDRAQPGLNSIIEVNPDARRIARALDDEWRVSGPRGPLHGVPVILKANIDTADQMYTSAGSTALAEHAPPTDAFVVKRLRDAGVVILGKANLSEWANFRSTRSTSGWSSVGGQTRNPYDLARTPCGSSSGSAVAVAANLTVISVGTETNGSIMCPAGINGIVGIKPTLGLISRNGIIPIAHSQDTAGPMARSVRDAAILLTAMTGIDADDQATANAEIQHDYSSNLTADGLRGKRVGVLRTYRGAGSNSAVDTLFDASIDVLRSRGAEIVDNVEIDTSGLGNAEYEVMLYEFRAGLNAYLENTSAPVSSLAAIIDYNEAHADTVMPIFDQGIFLASEAKGPLTEPAYLDALETGKRIATAGIDSALDEHALDVLVAPTNGPAWMIDPVYGDRYEIGSSTLAAVAGYPAITVPAGFVSGLPIGVSFMTTAWNEKQLIEIAYAFEQATEARRAPMLAP